MKALYFDGKELLYREDLKKPRADKNHSVIKVEYAAICNTDKAIIKGYKPDFRGVLGHEFVGTVVESEDKSLIGKNVVAEINEGCGDCFYCNNNLEKHCPDRKTTGIINHWGCFAEYLETANHLIHVLPSGLALEKAVYAEPLAAALEITNSVHIRPGDKVAVVGDGRLAYMIAQIINLTGADLSLIGKHPEKLALFERFAKTALHTKESYDIVVEATGSPGGLETALQIIRRRGSILMKSTYAQKVSIDLSFFVVNEIRLIGTRCGPFPPALKMLEQKLIDLPEVKYYPLKDYKKAFADSGFKVGFKI